MKSPKNNQTSEDQGTRTEDEVDIASVPRGDRGDGLPHDTSARSAGTRAEPIQKQQGAGAGFFIFISQPLSDNSTPARTLGALQIPGSDSRSPVIAGQMASDARYMACAGPAL